MSNQKRNEMKIYELNVFADGSRPEFNLLYTSRAAALAFAETIRDGSGVSEVWLRVWVKNPDDPGALTIESNEQIIATAR